MTRSDGSRIVYFGTGPGADARPSCLVVIGDNDELVRELGERLPSDPAPVVVLSAPPPDPVGSIKAIQVGPPFDADVWALIRAQFRVVGLVAIWTERAATTGLVGLEEIVSRGTPAVVGMPGGMGASPEEVPPGLVAIRHPGREGVVGMSDRETWLERSARTGVVPREARKQPFVHVDDLLSAYRVAVEALRAGSAGVWSVGPCPVFDPDHVRASGDIPPVAAVYAPVGPLPAARPPSELWDAAGAAGRRRGR